MDGWLEKRSAQPDLAGSGVVAQRCGKPRVGNSSWSPIFLPLCEAEPGPEDALRNEAHQEDMGAPSSHDFVTAMRRFANPVTIVATGASPERAGMTATAICSLSAEPPQLLACVNRGSSTAQAILRNGRFSVNLLDAAQSHLAHGFAGRDGTRGEARFQDDDWRAGPHGTPILVSSLVSFECLVAQTIAAATHMVLVGAVLGLDVAGEGSPLLYGAGRFGRWAKLGEGE